MKITDLSKEELESTGEKVKITDLFKQICDLLGLSNEEYEAKIADFFQVLSTDHRFIMLEKGFWDLRSRHQAKIIIEDDEEDIDANLEEEDEELEEDDENVYYDEDEPTDDDDDDLQGLVVVNDDSDEENSNLD